MVKGGDRWEVSGIIFQCTRSLFLNNYCMFIKYGGKTFMKKKKKTKTTRTIRLAVQIFFLVLIILFSINHYREEEGLEPLLLGSASLHAICPFGGIVSGYTYFAEGAFVRKTHASSFILMWLVLLLTIAFGPVFCGWVCPFGSVQEFVGKIGTKLFKGFENNVRLAHVEIFNIRCSNFVLLGEDRAQVRPQHALCACD